MSQLTDNIVEMLKIKSVSGDEKSIAAMLDWVKNKYAAEGVTVKEWNFEGASPVLLLANCDDYDFDVLTIGHLDVVPAKDEMFVPHIIENKIFARGSLDMKSSVAVCLETLQYAKNKKIKFGVLITTDEETTSNGMKALQKAGIIKAKIVLDTDTGDLYNLVEKYKHPVSIELSAKGKNAHSSKPWEGENAILKVINAINELEKYFPLYENEPSSTWVDTMAVTAFNSPTTYNVIPDNATARINFRLTEKTSLVELKKLLDSVCEKTKCSYEILLSSCGVYMDAKNPYIQKYLQIAEDITEKKINIGHSCGATDSRMFAASSVIIMHGINGANIHADNEYVEIDSILALAKIQKAFVDSLIED